VELAEGGIGRVPGLGGAAHQRGGGRQVGLAKGSVLQHQGLPDHGADVARLDAAVEDAHGGLVVTAFLEQIALAAHHQAGGLIGHVFKGLVADHVGQIGGFARLGYRPAAKRLLASAVPDSKTMASSAAIEGIRMLVPGWKADRADRPVLAPHCKTPSPSAQRHPAPKGAGNLPDARFR
jgi:hypothetical protein